MFLTRDKVQTILDNAPKGTDKKKILDGLIQRGYEIEGVDSGKRRSELAAPVVPEQTTTPAAPTDPAAPTEEKPGLLTRIKDDLIQRADKVGSIFRRKETSPGEKAVQFFGQGAGAAANAVEQTAMEIPGVEKVMKGIGSGIEWLATSDLSPIKKASESGPTILGKEMSGSDFLQKATELYDTDPNFKDTVDAVANIARLGGDVQAAVDSAMFVKNVTSKIGTTGAALVDGGIDGAAAASTKIADTAATAKDAIQLKVAEKNVNPQLETSANRLFLDGTKRLEDPIATYEKFLDSSKKAVTDNKADPAIATVGEEVGDAMKSVVAERKQAGATMAEELKKVADVKTDVLPTIDTFVKDLGDEGLAYDRVTQMMKKTASQSKMTGEDLKILEDYAKELQELGSKPTIGDLDAFLSRIPNEIDVYKSSKNLVGTTNAERIIKKSLSDLRKQFDPSTTGNADLAGYSEARAKYADLSGFIEEGQSYLGKLTQSGDFAKDASLAKSAVQSILNNGKKDWLIRLEELTGYPAVDKSVLALQAMKDAGDFRGDSLLRLMSEGSVPTSATGIARKLLEFLLNKGSEIVAGSPADQTRAFLRSLGEKTIQTSPTTKSPAATKAN